MRNYDDVVAQLRAAGLLEARLEIDGQIHRCQVDHLIVPGVGREKRGWYVLHELTDRSSNQVIVGSYGVWRGDDKGELKIELGKDFRLDKEEVAAIRVRQAADRKRAVAQRKREAQRAARRAAGGWAKALTAPPTDAPVDYLQRKGVAAHGLRYSESGALIVPIQDNNAGICGLQFILPANHPRKKKTGRDKEYWPKGIAKRGGYYLFGGSPSPILLMCEGYATAATLFEATGYPVAVAFDANNLLPVGENLRKRYASAKILICADDDYLQRCKQCGKHANISIPACSHCGKPHENHNPGVHSAQTAALAIDGKVVKPTFPADRQGKKLTDFNDLEQFPQGGRALVAQQIEVKLAEEGWTSQARASRSPLGVGEKGVMPGLLSLEEGVERFALIYPGSGSFFDFEDRIIAPKQDVLDILPDHAWREWKVHGARKIVRLDEVGFDPAGEDKKIRCNLWGGWPTTPKKGKCEKLLELLDYLCSGESNTADAFGWIMKWLAYPVQNPGAKMKTALVFHGGQGTGKNLFFEAVMKIYGEYGRIVDQAAIEDKFNDWASKKIFLIADEVVARQELFHQKNKIKSLITSDTIRINPKNVSCREERNHLNLVFLSNERQPLVLEDDDRRFMVVWTPEKLDEDFYRAVGDEIRNGGVEALHDVLLNWDLGDFSEHAKPLMTGAKKDLMDLSRNSEETFMEYWESGELGLPFCPCLSEELYLAYQRWCRRAGVKWPRDLGQFSNNIKKRHGWTTGNQWHYENVNCHGEARQRKGVLPPPELLLAAPANNSLEWRRLREQPVELNKRQWLTKCIFAFRNALQAFNE